MTEATKEANTDKVMEVKAEMETGEGGGSDAGGLPRGLDGAGIHLSGGGTTPQGGGGGYYGIDLVEVVWKAVTVIINFCLTAYITFHVVLHGFWESRGTGTTSLEAKLIHELMLLRSEVLYEIFLDL